MREAMHARGVALIPLVAPTTTPDRLARICSTAAGFVYCVGVTGVTGARRTIADDAIALLDSVRRLTPLPRALGFGLSTHEHLIALRGHAEAAVVGSALLDSIGQRPGRRGRRLRSDSSRDDRQRGGAGRVTQERVAPADAGRRRGRRPRRQVDQPPSADPRRPRARAGPTSATRRRRPTSLATAACLRACGVWVRDFPPARYALDGAGVGVEPAQPRRACSTAPTPAPPCGCSPGVLAGNDSRRRSTATRRCAGARWLRVVDPLRAMGAERRRVAGRDRAAPGARQARRSTALTWRSPVASAQVKSAILLAGLSADGPDHGRRAAADPRPHRADAAACAASTSCRNGAEVTVHPGPLEPFGLRVPGDLSSAAFFLALAASRPGWRVRCPGVGLNPGRTGILERAARRWAPRCVVEEGDPAGGVEPVGDVEVRGAACTASRSPGRSRCGASTSCRSSRCSRPRPRATPRSATPASCATRRSIASPSSRPGSGCSACRARAPPTRSTVHGPARLRAAHLDAAGDHRLAMAWAIAAALVPAGRRRLGRRRRGRRRGLLPGFFADLATLLGS